MHRLRHGGRRARSHDRTADRGAEGPRGGDRSKARTDCRGAAGTTVTAAAHAPSFSRRDFRLSFASHCPSLEQWSQAKPGADRTRSLACSKRTHTSVVTTGSAETSRLSTRNGLTAAFVVSPGKRPFLPPLPAEDFPPT